MGQPSIFSPPTWQPAPNQDMVPKSAPLRQHKTTAVVSVLRLIHSLLLGTAVTTAHPRDTVPID